MAVDRSWYSTYVDDSGDGDDGTPFALADLDALNNAIDAEIARLEAHHRCSAYHNTTESIPNDAWTALAFNAEDYDSHALHDLVTNNGRLTVPAAGAGVYAVSGSVTFGANATGARGIRIKKNGVTVQGYVFMPSTGATFSTIPAITLQLLLADGDYLTVEVYQNSGGALDAGNALREFANVFAMVRVT